MQRVNLTKSKIIKIICQYSLINAIYMLTPFIILPIVVATALITIINTNKEIIESNVKPSENEINSNKASTISPPANKKIKQILYKTKQHVQSLLIAYNYPLQFNNKRRNKKKINNNSFNNNFRIKPIFKNITTSDKMKNNKCYKT